MNRDDIIRMAREAWGLHCIPDSDVPKLKRFAALVAAAEREACAEACENICEYDDMCDGYYADTYAAAIRARGNSENL